MSMIELVETIKDTDILIILKKQPHRCPDCGEYTSYIKDYKVRKVSHNSLINRDTFLFYKCRRYLCKSCKISFVENNPFTANRRTKVSSKSIINILDDLKPYNETFSSVARRYNLSVTKVIELFDTHVQVQPKPLTQHICIDEFYFNRHAKYKYAFMIMDFDKKLILDIVKSRRYVILYDYFFKKTISQKKNVTHVYMDLYDGYRILVSEIFPNALVCADPFHVVKYINDALNAVRKRIMRKHANDKSSVEYKLLKYNHRILFKPEDNLDNQKYFLIRL